MIIKEYIKEFETFGLGMFVHFGLYSVLGKGEWAKTCLHIDDVEYEALANRFNPLPDWAEQLVITAKQAGCHYITITARHHDGYSLYDTCGLNDYDAPHTCGRDLIAEFVVACGKYGLIPFFYHTLLDWREPSFQSDFPRYLVYLRKSIQLLCTNYGTIGGIWFDGMWSKPYEDWEEDALYGCIRKYQPNAMIINNTGLSEQGKLGHIELDSVTFERGKPQPLNMDGAPKYVASEMCQVFGDHWGYAEEDFNYKSPAQIIRDLVTCRRCGSNFLLNVGPKGDGTLRLMDRAMYDLLGQWVSLHKEAIYTPRPTNIVVDNKPHDFILQEGNTYYLFCDNLPMAADPNVAQVQSQHYQECFQLHKKIVKVTWLDNGETVDFTQTKERVVIKTVPYNYGRQLVVRIAKIETV